MSSTRRIYLYTASLLTLLATLAGLLNVSGELIRLLAEGQGLAAVTHGPAALWLWITPAALVLWIVHWTLADHPARQLTVVGAAERRSETRKAILWAGQTATLAVVITQAVQALYQFLAHWLGRPPQPPPWPTDFLTPAVGALIALAAWGYLRWATVRDGDFGQEPDGIASYRRAYTTLFAVAGTAMAAIGGAELLRGLLTLAGQLFVYGRPAGAPWPREIAASLTAVIVGAPLALAAWRRANHPAAGTADAELNAAGRKAALTSWLSAGAILTLVSLAYLLWRGVLAITGQPVADGRTLWETRLIWPLAYLPGALVTWLTFGGRLRQDATQAVESPGAATLRRLYRYAMSAATLAAFWVGVTELLTLVASIALGRPDAAGLLALSLRERFALAAALTLVGGPAWWGYWWPTQAQARDAGPEAHTETASVVRTVYLYGVLTVAAVVAFIGLGLAVFGALGAAADVTGAAVTAAVALFWGAAHFLVIRGDERREDVKREAQDVKRETPNVSGEPPSIAQTPGPRRFERAALPQMAEALRTPQPPELQEPPAPISNFQLPISNLQPPIIAVLDGGDGKLGAALLAALRLALPPTVIYWPIGLNAAAQVAMLDALGEQTPPAVPADGLSRATLILGPSDVLASGGLDGEVAPELAAAIAAGPARKLLLPPRDARLRWVAAPDWPVERWVENAVIEAANAIRSE